MKFLFTFFVCIGILHCTAQDTTRYATFTKVGTEAEYPGGQSAWLRFLNKNLHYPDAGDVTGTVVVRFVVDSAGRVSDIKVVSGLRVDALSKEVIRVVRLSGKWISAIQNGHKVRSYKQIPFCIYLQSE